MSIGAGIAVAGIWIGVGLVGWKDGAAAIGVGMFAVFATLAVAAVSSN